MLKGLKDAHYFPLPSQGSIYTFSNIKLANNSNKLLVASLKREVYCFEYHEETSGILVPSLKEISFTYIPSAAEIISIDAFNKSETSNDFVIGITIIKNGADLNSIETYLNIYSEWEESEEFNLESIAQNCLNVELSYIPYYLSHTHIITWLNDEIINKEVAFLLSGSDNKIHVYRESKTNHSYKESDKDHFPEFNKLPSVVTWFDIIYYKDYTERLSAAGCECGYLRLCKADVKKNQILFNLSTRFICSITMVRFQLDHRFHLDERLSVLMPTAEEFNRNKEISINLLVLNSILPGVYFKDVKNYGLQKYCSLKRSEATSVSSCLELVDLNFDGSDELLIGNSAKELLLYEFSKEDGWHIVESKKVVSPVLGIKYVDLTGDGIKELAVFTMKGVYIFQHDTNAVSDRLLGKLRRLKLC